VNRDGSGSVDYGDRGVDRLRGLDLVKHLDLEKLRTYSFTVRRPWGSLTLRAYDAAELIEYLEKLGSLLSLIQDTLDRAGSR